MLNKIKKTFNQLIEQYVQDDNADFDCMDDDDQDKLITVYIKTIPRLDRWDLLDTADDLPLMVADAIETNDSEMLMKF